jgi:hypothetical protein
MAGSKRDQDFLKEGSRLDQVLGMIGGWWLVVGDWWFAS